MTSSATLSYRSRLAGMIGNLLEHYDNALFGLLAPFISPLFFECSDPLTALILTYGMLPLGLLARPLGSLVFGRIGDRWGRKKALCGSLIVMAVATMAMGLLPTFKQVGYLAPILLAVVRVLQNFCAAGQSSGGAIFVLEHTSQERKSWMSSLYDASSILGILLACAGVTVLAHFDWVQAGWRYLMLAGGVTALVGFWMRTGIQESHEFLAHTALKISTRQTLQLCRLPLMAIICVAGFSYTTYALAVTFMHGYIPLITSLSLADLMPLNTLLLALDMCLLPCFGYLATRFRKEQVMVAAASVSLLAAVPLFLLLQQASLLTVIVVRLVLIVAGVAFSAPWHAWAQELVPPPYRYTIISLGYAIGSQAIGAPAPAVSLWIYQKTRWAGGPALYLMFAALAALVAVVAAKRQSPYKIGTTQ